MGHKFQNTFFECFKLLEGEPIDSHWLAQWVSLQENSKKIKRIVGLAAVEDCLTQFFHTCLRHEWAELQNLSDSLLSDSIELGFYAAMTENDFSLSQWKATLRFFTLTNFAAENISPSLSEMACLFLIKQAPAFVNQTQKDLARVLLQMHRLHVTNKNSQTGSFLESEDKFLSLLDRFFKISPSAHPLFSDQFRNDTPKLLKVA